VLRLKKISKINGQKFKEKKNLLAKKILHFFEPTFSSGHSTLMLLQIIEKKKKNTKPQSYYIVAKHLVAKPWKKENNKIVICKAIYT
jgi:hypothetical protein